MRALDKLISFIFSIVMLVLSIILILVGVGVVEPQMIIGMLNEHIFVKEMIHSNVFNALTITGIVLFLASLKTTIFLSLFRIKDKSPILVKTQNGEVEIAQETIISTVKNVGFSFDNIKDVQAKMIKKGRGVIIYAVVLVYANSNIREITEEMQKQVKEVMKATTGVNVIEVNIKVKNIYQKQRKNEENEKGSIGKVNERIEDKESMQTENTAKEDASEKKEAEENMTNEVVLNDEVVADEKEDLDQISMDETTEKNH